MVLRVAAQGKDAKRPEEMLTIIDSWMYCLDCVRERYLALILSICVPVPKEIGYK